MTMYATVIRATLLIALLTLPPIAEATVYNLSADWSDAANPTGPWSYRVGTTLLPHNANWTIFPSPQPAYQPSNVSGNYLPAWYKATSVPAGFDNQVGDVIVHTNDNFNGNEALGAANVLFTVPAAGRYQISGGLWNANTSLVPGDFAPRPQDWRLFVNNTLMASGTLSGLPGDATRANPQTFNLANVLLNAGDTVRLDVSRNINAQAGFFVGTDLTIQTEAATTIDTFQLKAQFKQWCKGNPKIFELNNTKVTDGVTLTFTRDVNGDGVLSDVQITVNNTGSTDFDAFTLKGFAFPANKAGSKLDFAVSGVNPGNDTHFFTIRGQASLNKLGVLTKVTGAWAALYTSRYTVDKKTGQLSDETECFGRGTLLTGNKLP